MFLRLFVLLLIVGCSSTKPTPYQKEKDKEGFADSYFENMKVASFKGNSYSKKDQVQLYAQFRAITRCVDSEKQHANIIDIFDKTIEREVMRTTGSSWGPAYFGMYPYYSRHSNFGVSAGFNTISADSWNETLVYPVFEVYYTCANSILRPQLIFKELTAEQMKHLVQDVRGAIQIDQIPDTSPNKNTVEVGDIILRAQGKRIEKVYELIRLFSPTLPIVPVQVMRDGQRREASLNSVDITSQVEASEKDIIKRVCKNKDQRRQKKLKKEKVCQ
jgi:hypothetical protein